MSVITLVADIDEQKLSQAITRAVGHAVRRYDVLNAGSKSGAAGICGQYAAPSLKCFSDDGRESLITLFVRRDRKARPGFRQEHHYQNLRSMGLPIPRMHGAWLDAAGREILVLENVHEVEVNDEQWTANAENCAALLSLMARFASIKAPISYWALIGRDMAARGEYSRSWNTWMGWAIYVFDWVWRLAREDKLGIELGLWCKEHLDTCAKLQESARATLNLSGRLEQGLIHGDLHAGNVGWRHGTDRQLVMFDFGDVMIDFLLYDVAMHLGCPDELSPLKDMSREGLADYYLRELKAYSGRELPMKQFLSDVRLIWHMYKLNLWDLLPNELGGMAYCAPKTVDNQAIRLEALRKRLQALVNQLPLVHAGS